jgi:hypothetical protein
MLPVVQLIGKTALDYLSGSIDKSELRTWIAPKSDFEKLELECSDIWANIFSDNYDGRYHRQAWKIGENCVHCK